MSPSANNLSVVRSWITGFFTWSLGVDSSTEHFEEPAGRMHLHSWLTKKLLLLERTAAVGSLKRNLKVEGVKALSSPCSIFFWWGHNLKNILEILKEAHMHKHIICFNGKMNEKQYNVGNVLWIKTFPDWSSIIWEVRFKFNKDSFLFNWKCFIHLLFFRTC